jgi:hypothetical protein
MTVSFEQGQYKNYLLENMCVRQVRELPVTLFEMQHVFIAHFHTANKGFMREHGCLWVSSGSRSVAEHVDLVCSRQLQRGLNFFIFVKPLALFDNLFEKVNIESDLCSLCHKCVTAFVFLGLIKDNQVMKTLSFFAALDFAEQVNRLGLDAHTLELHLSDNELHGIQAKRVEEGHNCH